MPTLVQTPAHLTSRFLQAKLIIGPSTDFVAKVGKVSIDDDNAVFCTDYGFATDGRDLRTGLVFRKPLVQILVRSLDYQAACNKMVEIMDRLDKMLPSDFEVFDFEGSSFQIVNFSYQSGPLYLGEEEKNLRQSFTSNYKLTVKPF